MLCDGKFRRFFLPAMFNSQWNTEAYNKEEGRENNVRETQIILGPFRMLQPFRNTIEGPKVIDPDHEQHR